MTKLPIAQALAARGFVVFPVKPGAKSPPLLSDWPNKATSNTAEIEMLWAAVPEANVAIHCSGLCVVDVDVKDGGDDTFNVLEDLHGWPPTLTTRTPTQGRHLFYRLPEGHPGVTNSVRRLGGGLDIRSTGGYVIAPGSDVEAGRYHFEADVPIAAVPAWLLKLLTPVVPKTGTDKPKSGTPVPDAPDPAVERALAWLAGQPSGEGAYATACGLRDRGLSLAQALDAMGRHDPRPHVPDKVRHAYRYASGIPGAKAVLESDLPAPAGAPPPVEKSTVLRLAEFANSESRTQGYLVKGLLQRGSYAEAYGAPGEGKTFVALDLAYHVAAGTLWMSRAVHQGVVLYLAYEGTGGLVARAKALGRHYGRLDVALYIADSSYNLRDLAGRAALGQTIANLPEKPVLIVIDTFARALMGGDENSAQDVGAFNSAIAALQKSTGACVLLIHHSGKNKAAGARGSSALLGALDTELEIDGGNVTPTKQRDIELGEPIGFKLVPLIVGTDQDGDDVTSCVVLPSIVSAGDLPTLKGNSDRAFKTLCKLAPDNAPVTLEAWSEACTAFLGTRDLRKKFYDIHQGLLEKGYVVANSDGLLTRRMV